MALIGLVWEPMHRVLPSCPGLVWMLVWPSRHNLKLVSWVSGTIRYQEKIEHQWSNISVFANPSLSPGQKGCTNSERQASDSVRARSMPSGGTNFGIFLVYRSIQ